MDVRHLGEVSVSGAPNFRLACIFFHNILQVKLQRFEVRLLHSLEDVEHNARESIFVEINFLVVGHLADLAIILSVESWLLALQGFIPDVCESRWQRGCDCTAEQIHGAILCHGLRCSESYNC